MYTWARRKSHPSVAAPRESVHTHRGARARSPPHALTPHAHTTPVAAARVRRRRTCGTGDEPGQPGAGDARPGTRTSGPGDSAARWGGDSGEGARRDTAAGEGAGGRGRAACGDSDAPQHGDSDGVTLRETGASRGRHRRRPGGAAARGLARARAATRTRETRRATAAGQRASPPAAGGGARRAGTRTHARAAPRTGDAPGGRSGATDGVAGAGGRRTPGGGRRVLVRDSDERPSVLHAEAASGSVDGRDTRHHVGPSAAGPSLDRLGRGPARQTTRSRGRGCRRPSTRHSRETPGAATDHVRGPGGEDSDGGACERPAPATSCPLHAPATTASAHGQRRGPTRAHGPGGRAPLFSSTPFQEADAYRPGRVGRDASLLFSFVPFSLRRAGARDSDAYKCTRHQSLRVIAS